MCSSDLNPLGGSATLAGGLQLTNRTATVEIGPLSSPQSQNVVISLTLRDEESDTVDLRLEVDTGSGFQDIP